MLREDAQWHLDSAAKWLRGQHDATTAWLDSSGEALSDSERDEEFELSGSRRPKLLRGSSAPSGGGLIGVDADGRGRTQGPVARDGPLGRSMLRRRSSSRCRPRRLWTAELIRHNRRFEQQLGTGAIVQSIGVAAGEVEDEEQVEVEDAGDEDDARLRDAMEFDERRWYISPPQGESSPSYLCVYCPSSVPDPTAAHRQRPPRLRASIRPSDSPSPPQPSWPSPPPSPSSAPPSPPSPTPRSPPTGPPPWQPPPAQPA